MTETTIDTTEAVIDDGDIFDFIEGGGGEDVPYNTILRVWREVLAPAEDERKARVTPQWASRICSSYHGVSFADMPAFKDLYFDKIRDLALVVDAEIESDAECLNMMTAEEDVEHNSHHYLNILVNWQLTFLQWELDWDPVNVWAAVEIAAIAEIHKMFFDQTGLSALLDNIQFEVTDADREYMANALQALKDAREGR
jgi:hypothetical protein